MESNNEVVALKDTLEALEPKFENFKATHTQQLGQLEQRVDALDTAYARSALPDGLPQSSGSVPMRAGRFAVDVNGRRLPVLGKGEPLSRHFTPDGEGESWSMGDFVKASMGLRPQGAVLERGTATVPQYVSAEIIDAIRVKARLFQAGALTIPIEGKTTLCRIDADPTVYEHTEAADDIVESVPTLTPVELDPKALVALVPLSMELVQDSPNLDAALAMSLAGAFSTKLDALGIAKILADTDVPESQASQLTDDWTGTLAAAGAMLALNQDVPKAMISGPGDWATRAAQVAEALHWLGAPPKLEDMLDLPTTSMTDGFAILGDFSLGVGVAVRMDLQLELSRFQKPTYGSHLLVAYARMAAYVIQPNALFNQIAVV